MKTVIQLVISVLFLTMVNQVSAAVEETGISNPSAGLKRGLGSSQAVVEKYNGMETKLRMSLDNNLHGFIEGKVCDNCKKIRLSVTPETKAYKNNIEVPLGRAKNRLGRFVTVIYEVKTKHATAIRW